MSIFKKKRTIKVHCTHSRLGKIITQEVKYVESNYKRNVYRIHTQSGYIITVEVTK